MSDPSSSQEDAAEGQKRKERQPLRRSPGKRQDRGRCKHRPPAQQAQFRQTTLSVISSSAIPPAAPTSALEHFHPSGGHQVVEHAQNTDEQAQNELPRAFPLAQASHSMETDERTSTSSVTAPVEALFPLEPSTREQPLSPAQLSSARGPAAATAPSNTLPSRSSNPPGAPVSGSPWVEDTTGAPIDPTLLRKRFSLWTQGHYGTLFNTVKTEHAKKKTKLLSAPYEVHLRKVARLVDEGLLSKAAARLCSRGVEEPSSDLLERVQALFPVALPPRCPPVLASPAEVTTAEIRKLILTAPSGLACGPSALRFEHLRFFTGRKVVCDDAVIDGMTRVVNCALPGELSSCLRPFLCGGRLVPLKKKDGSIRPLIVGEVLRAIIAKIGVRVAAAAAIDLQPLQVGVGGKGPWIQAAVLTMRGWSERLRENDIILKVDLSNAYNTINRSACLTEVSERCPELLAWANWCLGGPSEVYLGREVIHCHTGVQQGDPLAPTFFAMGLHGAIEALDDTPGLAQQWFLDDGGLCGSATAVGPVFAILQNRLLERGLRVNTKKCEIYALGRPRLEGALSKVPVEDCHDKWSYLGSPLREQTLDAVSGTLRRIKVE